MKKIAYCGNDCSTCPRYIATKKNSISELEYTALIWQQMGWRNELLSSEEMRCYGCPSVKWCRYQIKECCEEKELENCGQCNEYLCVKVLNAFHKSDRYEQKSKDILAPEISDQFSQAFFNKPENLAQARSLNSRKKSPNVDSNENNFKIAGSKHFSLNFRPLASNEEAPMDLLLLADPSEELVKSYLEKGICYIAELGDEVIGVVLTLETKAQNIEIMNVAVKEEYQNQGFGKKFLKFVIAEIKKSDATSIEIGTGNPGVHQMMLYQKCGFRIVGVDLDFFRRTHPERIYENGLECRDMIRMKIDLTEED